MVSVSGFIGSGKEGNVVIHQSEGGSPGAVVRNSELLQSDLNTEVDVNTDSVDSTLRCSTTMMETEIMSSH